MNPMICKADDTRRGFITITVGPARRADRARFGLLDALIIFGLLACTAAVLRVAL
jgi:hypothetical protein